MQQLRLVDLVLYPRLLGSVLALRATAEIFSEIAQTAFFGSSFSFEDAIHAPLLIVGPLLLVVLLIACRIWNFTILPALYPQEPKEIPYWVGEQRSRYLGFPFSERDQGMLTST